jgi:hypothetical protein
MKDAVIVGHEHTAQIEDLLCDSADAYSEGVHPTVRVVRRESVSV